MTRIRTDLHGFYFHVLIRLNLPLREVAFPLSFYKTLGTLSVPLNTKKSAQLIWYNFVLSIQFN